MEDAYRRYAAERGGLPPTGIQTGRDFPGYLPRENPQLNDRIASTWRTHDLLGVPPEALRNGIPPYGAGGLTASELASLGGSSVSGLGGLPGGVGPGVGSRIGLGGVPGGAGFGGLPPSLDDSVLMGQRQGLLGMDPALAGKSAANSEFYSARTDASLRLPDSATSDPSSRLPDHLKPDASSSTIFIEGLPADCTRREVAHIFRPFIGYKQIRVIHKEPRRADGVPYVLCFVEFADAKCAATALSALQGYKFDDAEHDSGPLRMQLAKFPGSRPADEHRSRV